MKPRAIAGVLILLGICACAHNFGVHAESRFDSDAISESVQTVTHSRGLLADEKSGESKLKSAAAKANASGDPNIPGGGDQEDDPKEKKSITVKSKVGKTGEEEVTVTKASTLKSSKPKVKGGKCACKDEPPPSSELSCKQHERRYNCKATWMEGYCKCTCGTCQDPPLDKTTPRPPKPPVSVTTQDKPAVRSKAEKTGAHTEDDKKPRKNKKAVKKSPKRVEKKGDNEKEAEEKVVAASAPVFVTWKAPSRNPPPKVQTGNKEEKKTSKKRVQKKSAVEAGEEDEDETEGVVAVKTKEKKTEKRKKKRDVGLKWGSTATQDEDLVAGGSKLKKRTRPRKAGKTTAEEREAEESKCVDLPPPWSPLTCEQQADLGKCDRDWIQGYCLVSCSKCHILDTGEVEQHDDPAVVSCPKSCSNDPPPYSPVSCEDQKINGKCGQSWMKGFCQCTCGTCPELRAKFEKDLKKKREAKAKALAKRGPCRKLKGKKLKKCLKKQKKKIKVDATKALVTSRLPKGHSRFTILHFNDFHSRFEPADAYHGICDDWENREGKCHGGIARLKTVIEEERAAAKARGEEVLLLDAGDDFVGTQWSNNYKGKALAHFYNRLDIDAATLGNHEFDYGPDVLTNFITEVNYPYVSANLKPNGHWIGNHVSDFVVKEINGTWVGICGSTSEVTMSWSKPWPVSFEHSPTKARECVQRVKDLGIDIVILLSHEGLNADRYLGRQVPGIDLIIGGHSHAFLYDGTPPSLSYYHGQPHRDHIWDGYPAWVDSWIEAGVRVPIVQAGWASRYLGRLTVEFDEDGTLVDIQGKPILLGGEASDNPVEEDEDWKQEVAEWKWW